MPSPETAEPLGGAGEATKRCPYCAETIKAAAIKCRYCQSDLTGTALDAEAPAQPPPPAPSPDSTAVAPARSSRRPSLPRPALRIARGPALAVIAVALVLALVFAALAFRDWRKASDLDASDEASRTVQATVSDKVEALLSYKYASFDDDLAAAEKSMTSSFEKEYSPTVAEIRDRAVQQKRSQQADVRAVAVLASTSDEVQTLVFVDTVSTTEGSKKQRIMQNRIKVTMVKQGGSWLIDDLTVPQS